MWSGSRIAQLDFPFWTPRGEIANAEFQQMDFHAEKRNNYEIK
jgi:hypothetical protein